VQILFDDTFAKTGIFAEDGVGERRAGEGVGQGVRGGQGEEVGQGAMVGQGEGVG